MTQSLHSDAKRRHTKEPGLDSASLLEVNISKILHCFTKDGDGAYPPAVATTMFTVACVLLILPRLLQICTRRFLKNVLRLLLIATLFTFLVIVLLYITSIQANDIFCFFATKRMIELMGLNWEPFVGVFLMVVLALVNVECAHLLKEAFLKGRNYLKHLRKTKRDREKPARTPACQPKPVSCT